jgi:hypothetical protein
MTVKFLVNKTRECWEGCYYPYVVCCPWSADKDPYVIRIRRKATMAAQSTHSNGTNAESIETQIVPGDRVQRSLDYITIDKAVAPTTPTIQR